MPDLPVTVYTTDTGARHPGVLLQALLRDVVASRELAWRLFVRDLSAAYRQTYFGYVWAFLPPLAASMTFIFLNSQGIVRIESEGIPYAAFAMIGTLLWQLFVDAVNSPSQSLQGAKSMLAKVNFPREAILLSGLYMVLFNFTIRLVLLAGAMLTWKVRPDSGLLYFPIAMAALLVCGYSVGLALAPIGMLYGDVTKALPILTSFWMLLTPVVYPARTEGLAGWLATWNPAAPLLTTARETLTGASFTHLPSFVLVSTLAAAVLVLGLLGFRLAMPHLIARMGN